ncbi:hypothetical protein Tco_1469395 [Tanacetum coccineum]
MLSSGPVIFAVLGLVTYLVANLTLDTARSRWAYAFHQNKASLVRVPVANVTLSSSAHLLRENTNSVHSNQQIRGSLGPVFLLGLLAFAIDVACAFRAEEMPSLISCRMAAKVMAGVSDVDVLLGALRGYGMIHEDGDNDAISGNDDKLVTIRYKTGLPFKI